MQMRRKIMGDVAPWVRCLECQASVTVHEQYIVDYFYSRPVFCPKCKTTIDWWKAILREVQDNFMHNQAFMPIGAQSKFFVLKLKSVERCHYKLTDYGIPEDANILYVNYTPSGNDQGSLIPVEFHGNIPTRHWPRHSVTLWPVPFGNTDNLSENEVNVYVTWVPHTAYDDIWGRLVDAFQAYVAGRYSEIVVPANVAVEASLSSCLTGFLAGMVGNQRAESFLEQAATYSHQLNVVLPVIAVLTNIPRLDEHVRGLLNRLRDLRNQMAHRGCLDNAIKKEEAAELICAALFGFRYMSFVKSELARK